MIQQKIQSVIVAINSLAGQIPPEAWEVLKNARAELSDAAEMTEALENRITVEQLTGMIHQHRRALGGMSNG